MAIPQITAEEFAAYTQRQQAAGQTAQSKVVKRQEQKCPGFHILISLIEVWTPEDVFKPMDAPKEKPLIFAECESVNIQENYTGLVETATVRFPRGTTVKKTIVVKSEVDASTDNAGVVQEVRTGSKVAGADDFHPGDRIRIRLGYTEDPKVATMCKVSRGKPSIYTSNDVLTEYKKHLTVVFDGFIADCSVETPIELKCENMAYLLKLVTCKKMTTAMGTTVHDLLYTKNVKKDKDGKKGADGGGGVYGLLYGTGILPHSALNERDAKGKLKVDITVGKCQIDDNLTVFDVLSQWKKWKIFPYIKYDGGQPALMVNRTYFSEIGPDSIVYGKSPVAKIDFRYNVAENGLTMVRLDRKRLAVTASCKGSKTGKSEPTGEEVISLTIIPNPQWEPGSKSEDKYRIVKETKISKKMMKKHHIKMANPDSVKVDLSQYTVVEYFSKKTGLTHDQLLEEAIQFHDSYSMNGIDGSLSLFGDFALHSGDIVELYDDRYSYKNGIYLVESCVTDFGTRGYRQSLTLPYCVSRQAGTTSNQIDKDNEKEERQQ